LGKAVEDPDIFDYASVPHFPISTAPGENFMQVLIRVLWFIFDINLPKIQSHLY